MGGVCQQHPTIRCLHVGWFDPRGDIRDPGRHPDTPLVRRGPMGFLDLAVLTSRERLVRTLHQVPRDSTVVRATGVCCNGKEVFDMAAGGRIPVVDVVALFVLCAFPARRTQTPDGRPLTAFPFPHARDRGRATVPHVQPRMAVPSNGPNMTKRRRTTLVIGVVLAASTLMLTQRYLRDLHTYGIGARFARPLDVQIPAGLTSIRAESCGQCHQAIYAEWKATIHAAAWSDDYFQTDWAWDDRKQNCLNCHTPLVNQQPDLVTGFVDNDLWQPILAPNPDYDEALRDEGVTCAACHVRDGVIVGPHPTDLAPHASRQVPNMTSGMEPCLRCHVTPLPDELSGPTTGICSTVSEIEAQERQPDCIACHMPEVTRPLVEGYPARPGRHHTWRGGHTPEMVRPDLRVDVREVAQAGAAYTYEVVLTNVGTHHMLPTGTPDRHIEVTVRLLDGLGRELQATRHRVIRRILWRPVILELSDTRLPYLEPQVVPFAFELDDPSAPHVLEVTADYHFVEAWRRAQIGLPEDSHAPYRLLEQRVPVGP